MNELGKDKCTTIKNMKNKSLIFSIKWKTKNLTLKNWRHFKKLN